MSASFFSVELKGAFSEKDAYKRVLALTNVFREIGDLCPFDDNAELLVRDKHLVRFLVLALPLMESVTDRTILTLLFKFQGNLYFLKNFLDSLGVIIRLNEVPNSELYESIFGRHFGQASETSRNLPALDAKSAEESFGDFVNNQTCPEVRINLFNIKMASFEYWLRGLKILQLVEK